MDPTQDTIGIIDYFGKYLGKGIQVAITIEPHGGCQVTFTKEFVLGVKGGGFRKEVKVASGYSESNPLLAAQQAEQRWEKAE